MSTNSSTPKANRSINSLGIDMPWGAQQDIVICPDTKSVNAPTLSRLHMHVRVMCKEELMHILPC